MLDGTGTFFGGKLIATSIQGISKARERQVAAHTVGRKYLKHAPYVVPDVFELRSIMVHVCGMGD
jgi:hypothetical protein